MDDLQNSEASKTVEEESKNTTSNKLLRNTLPNSSLPESLTTENAYEVFSNESILNQTDYVENDRGTHARSRSFSQLLVGAMAPSGLLNPLSSTLVASPRFQAQFGMSHQQALASVTAQAVQAQDKMQIQSGYPPSSSSVHPYSVLGDITPQLKNPLLGSGDMPITFVVDEQSNNDKDVQPNQLDLKSLQGDLKTPCDGYNWRKYGQKQVKGSERSRSYYRCSNTKCIVKKTIERCSDGFVHEIVYKGHHNHERPEKIRSSKENFHPAGSSGETDKVNVAGGKSCIADSSLSSQEYGCVSDSSCQQLQNSTNVRDTILTVSNEGNDDEPSPKRRNKDTISESQVFQFKIGREPKVVLQTESETGILGDGYRWRKYGQKLVKGNPNPRSYYKCTTMGCPVRKHVEKASDNTKAILVTYEGNHNHDLPSPKGGRDPSASALLYAAAAMTNGGELKSPSLFTYRLTSTRTKANRFDEKTLELGGQKALESAQTLLSIGLNPSISSSPDKNEEKRNIIERPLLSEAHAAVSV